MGVDCWMRCSDDMDLNMMDLTPDQDTLPELVIGQKITVTAHDLAFGGAGVARHEHLVIFVPGALPGEEIEIEITEVKKNFARGRLLRLLRPSPDRVQPPCPYFGECGGCQYQHYAYPAQLQLKHKQVTDIMQRIGGFAQPVVTPVVPCPQPYGYRNRIMVRSQWDKFKQALVIGFIKADNRLVVDVEECRIAEPGLNEQLKQVRAKPPHKGGIKVMLRVPAPGWEVPHDSFFQNNFFLLPRLVEVVRERLHSSRNRFLIDAYCGVGFFSIELADLVETFVGVEYDHMAIKAARINMNRRSRVNGEYLAGKTEDLLPKLLNRFAPADTTLILDPPRTGCPREFLEQLKEIHPSQIIYVSCHPATLARDLRMLCAEGVYELVQVTPLDMFPQTQHIECVADLRFRGSHNS